VAEENEGPEAGGEASPGVDPAAIALALAGASREDAHEFLKKAGHLADLQAKELAHELRLRHWSLQLRHASAILKFTLEVSLALIGVAIACFLGAVVWNAAHDDGLVIEAFSVPPDLAARGLSGQVVATQMLDNLSALQAQSNSVRALSTYANNWGNDLKVEIPETGVSLGELNGYLHQLLGRQTHITGEVVHTPAGIAITARTGIDSGQRFSGSEADFDSLLQQAAEAVYRRTQPYRYGVYLFTLGKFPEAQAFFTEQAATGLPVDRAWANIGLTNIFLSRDLYQEDDDAARAAVRINPDFAFGWSKVAASAGGLGQGEAELAASKTTLRLLPTAKDMQPAAVLTQQHQAMVRTDDLLGDYAGSLDEQRKQYPGLEISADAARQVREVLSSPGPTLAAAILFPTTYAASLASDHDLAGARHVLDQAPDFIAAVQDAAAVRHDSRSQISGGAAQSFRALELSIALEAGDWRRIRQLAPAMDSEEAKLAAAFFGGVHLSTTVWPVLAYAEAMTGDFAAAHRLIDKTPADCDLCLRMRGRIDAAEKNYNGAGFWFDRAAQLAPSIPFAEADWGQMLLDKGDTDAAIAKFTVANKKGPHFADPLEGWGEALMAKKEPDAALAKFEGANKYAPNWGRLHLKWGEALFYAGKKDDARKEFGKAATLDMTTAEKAELGRQL
jgi:tetratricopeptide (TPR) repeat protein